MALAKESHLAWRNEILQALAQFLTLPEKADTEWKVIRPTVKAYKAAVDLVSEVSVATMPLPVVAPDHNGGIQFEWGKGAYALEIGVLPNGTFEILKVTPSAEDEMQASFTTAKNLIGWFARM